MNTDSPKSSIETNEKFNPKEVLEYYLPLMITAGDYALKIQSNVASHDSKESKGDIEYTPITQALTDADVSIQNMFEIATIAKYPEFSVNMEEADSSLNIKYFPTDSDILLTLDPINGTKFYKDNLPIFDIILTVLEKGEIKAAVTYVPGKKQFYMAIKDNGAFTTTKDEVMANKPWRKHELKKDSDTVLTYRLQDEERERLKNAGVNLYDLNIDYDKDSCRVSIFSILDGGTSAFIKRKPSVIDWGAIAFIVEEAGGVVSDFNGKKIQSFTDFENLRIPAIVTSVSREVHEKIIRVLSGETAEKNIPDTKSV